MPSAVNWLSYMHITGLPCYIGVLARIVYGFRLAGGTHGEVYAMSTFALAGSTHGGVYVRGTHGEVHVTSTFDLAFS